MVLLKTLLWHAAKHVAGNPVLRRKAMDAAGRAKPTAEVALREAKRAAEEAPPLNDPSAFLRNLASRRERIKAAATRPPSPLDEDFEAEDLDASQWREVDKEEPPEKR